MERKRFGPTRVDVATIGQGSWHMGESRRTRDREVAALRLGLQLGMTHVDTAEMYGSGSAEEIVAEALAGVRRETVFLTSKVLPENASRKGTVRACERSLKRLGTEYLDLYLLHWPGSHPIHETMAGMEDLVRDGKIRSLGVSNFDVSELREAIAALSRERIACNQVLYNLSHRGIERELLPFCRENEIAVVGYTPLAHGGFPSRGGAGLSVLERIAERHGGTPRQVALRFLTRSPELFAIPKAVDPEHVRENAAATALTLTPDDVAAIDEAFPAPRRRVPLETA